MIFYLIFLFAPYISTAIFALLAYILWYTLCTNVTLTFALTCRNHEVIALHIESINPDFHLRGRYESVLHPVDNTWYTMPQSPTQDWNLPLDDPTPDNN